MAGFDEDLIYLKKLPHERVAPEFVSVPFVKVSVVSVDFLQRFLPGKDISYSRDLKFRYPSWLVSAKMDFFFKYMVGAGFVYLSALGTVMMVAWGPSLQSFYLLFYAAFAAVFITTVSFDRRNRAADRRRRCLRQLRRAIEGMYRSNDPVAAIRHTGEASRMLRSSLRAEGGFRRPPPAISDYFDRLTLVMVDIGVEGSFYPDIRILRLELKLMLLEFYAAIAVGREDLLPGIRERFDRIPTLDAQDGSGLRELNIEYVNSVHGLARLDFIKEYFYPIAGWCSFVVALLALILK